MKSTATELKKPSAGRDFQLASARAPQLGNSGREDNTPSVVPSLNGFAGVLETLADRLSYGPPGTANWIGGSIVAAESKLRVLRMILQWSSTKGRPARLLDIGSQIASLPVYAVRLGIHAAAVDNGEFATDCALAARHMGVDYRIADAGRERLPFDDASFDFVTYMDVIEHHAYSPKRVLLEARRLLSPGGLLVVTTPNHASIYNRFALLLGKSVLDPFDYFFEGRAGDEVYPGHHREFTRAELRTMLEKTGFRVLECKSRGEGFGPQLRAVRGEAVNGWPAAVKKFGKFVVAETLEPVWSFVPASLGRVLWAVGQQSESTIQSGAVL